MKAFDYQVSRMQKREIWEKFTMLLIALLAWCGSASAQHWTPVTFPFPGGAGTAMLETNGNVMVQDTTGSGGTGLGLWWELVPDDTGDYSNGVWALLSLPPVGYAPQFYGSAVLPDDRIVFEGGEYNGSVQDDTTMGAVFDPKTLVWTSIAPPSGWTKIGDAPTVVLPNGKLMLGSCCSKQQAILNASTLTWTATGAGKADSNSEEGWTLLPNGKVLAVDTQNGTQSELYDPSTGKWTSAGSTIVSLRNGCGGGIVPELGPAILRPNGTVFAAGASSNTAIYNYKTGVWTTGPTFPGGRGVVDGPAALLPDGNVLVGASPKSPCFTVSTKYYEFNGSTLTAAPNPPNASVNTSYYTRMLVLPTGHVLLTDGSSDVEVYVPAGSAKSSWLPTITSAPSTVTRGNGYTVKGTQFNGLSQACAYGDDVQCATNYPLVRMTNTATGHVYYARTKSFSTMGVATGAAIVSCTFVPPTAMETGAATMEVVANGLASVAVSLTVK